MPGLGVKPAAFDADIDEKAGRRSACSEPHQVTHCYLPTMRPVTARGRRIGENRAVAYTDVAFEELLDLIAAETPAPGGGSVAAFVTEMAAASLAAMTARFAHD